MVGIVNEYRHFLPAQHPKFLVTVTQEVAKKDKLLSLNASRENGLVTVKFIFLFNFENNTTPLWSMKNPKMERERNHLMTIR